VFNVYPSYLKTPAGYALPAPHPRLAGSPSRPWYDLHIRPVITACFQSGKILGISVVTFEVSNCTIFRIHLSLTPPGELRVRALPHLS